MHALIPQNFDDAEETEIAYDWVWIVEQNPKQGHLLSLPVVDGAVMVTRHRDDSS